jgi:hypothetical protein
MKKQNGKKSDKAKLAKGAEDIKKAEKEKASLEPVVIPESTRPIKDISADRVTLLEGHIGLKLAEDTPIEENLRILEWTTQLSDHVGFMIGDVLNFGSTKWGNKYKAAVNQTGLAYTTLANYASVAKAVPAGKRVAALSFSHYQIIQGLLTEPKVIDLVEKVGKEVTAGSKITKAELRIKALKVAPRKKKTPKKVTSGKHKRKSKQPELPPYVPPQEQQSILDALEKDLSKINAKIQTTVVDLSNIGKDTKSTVLNLLCELDNKEKQRWLKLLDPIFSLYNTVDRITSSYT